MSLNPVALWLIFSCSRDDWAIVGSTGAYAWQWLLSRFSHQLPLENLELDSHRQRLAAAACQGLDDGPACP